eukprot:1566510-Amphidinium_carterae.1
MQKKASEAQRKFRTRAGQDKAEGGGVSQSTGVQRHGHQRQGRGHEDIDLGRVHGCAACDAVTAAAVALLAHSKDKKFACTCNAYSPTINYYSNNSNNFAPQ